MAFDLVSLLQHPDFKSQTLQAQPQVTQETSSFSTLPSSSSSSSSPSSNQFQHISLLQSLQEQQQQQNQNQTFHSPPKSEFVPLSPHLSSRSSTPTGDFETVKQMLHEFVNNCTNRWETGSVISRFHLFQESIGCVLWEGKYFITGTDLVRYVSWRFRMEGEPIFEQKKFEEGIFSDLRNLKPGNGAVLEEPRSKFLDFLFKLNCIRTHKKQKVFLWRAVQFEKLFQEALRREKKRDINPVVDSLLSLGVASKPSIGSKRPRPAEVETPTPSIQTPSPQEDAVQQQPPKKRSLLSISSLIETPVSAPASPDRVLSTPQRTHQSPLVSVSNLFLNSLTPPVSESDPYSPRPSRLCEAESLPSSPSYQS